MSRMSVKFQYKDWDLFDALDAIWAYDSGARDSGVADEGLRSAVKAHFDGLSVAGSRIAIGRYARRYLTDEGLAHGYGVRDIVDFLEWFGPFMRG